MFVFTFPPQCWINETSVFLCQMPSWNICRGSDSRNARTDCTHTQTHTPECDFKATHAEACWRECVGQCSPHSYLRRVILVLPHTATLFAGASQCLFGTGLFGWTVVDGTVWGTVPLTQRLSRSTARGFHPNMHTLANRPTCGGNPPLNRLSCPYSTTLVGRKAENEEKPWVITHLRRMRGDRKVIRPVWCVQM